MAGKDRLQFILDMVDKVSAPARRVEKSLGSVWSRLTKLQRDDKGRFLPHWTKRIGAAIAPLKTFGGGLQSVGKSALKVAAGLALAGGAAIGITYAAASYVKDAIAFKDQSKAAMAAFMGSESAAEGTYQNVLNLARFLRVPARGAIEGVNQLLGAGFDLQTAMDLFKGSLDLSRLKGADPKVLATILGQIKAKGKLQTEELLQLAESGGLGVDKVYKELGKLKGIDVSTAAGMASLVKQLEGGAIDSATAVKAVLGAIQAMTGKELGKYAEGARNSLGAIWEGFSDLPDQFLLRADVSGMQPAIDFFGKLLDLLDPTKESGQEVLGMISQLAKDVGAAFAGMDPKVVVTDLIDLTRNVILLSKAFASGGWTTFVAAMKPIGDIFGTANGGAEGLTQRAEMLGKALGAIAAVLVYFVIAVGAVAVGLYTVGVGILWLIDQLAAFVAWWHGTLGAFVDLGAAIVDGIMNGITSAWPKLKSAWNNLVGQLPSVVADKLKIASPSKVTFYQGTMITEGLLQGIEAANDNVGGPAAALATIAADTGAAPSSASAPAPTASASGGGVTVQIFVTVTAAAGMNEGEAKAQGEAIGEGLASKLADVLERAGKQVAA